MSVSGRVIFSGVIQLSQMYCVFDCKVPSLWLHDAVPLPKKNGHRTLYHAHVQAWSVAPGVVNWVRQRA